ncbi:MAG: hypothetical protein M1133_11105 [Armatimonadetes bacterium]|nr:hypothetical protein [Armatimonadota bacterium]
MRLFCGYLALGMLLAGNPPACACYSGLLIIPTTDTVTPGAFSVELQTDGTVPGRSVTTRLLNTQFGVSDRLEAGLDIDLSTEADQKLLPNFKYLVFGNNDGELSGAVGVCSIQPTVGNDPYVVIGRTWGACRLFSGALRANGTGRWFAGADYKLNRHLTLMADFTNGGENYSSFGFNYQFDKRFAIMAGAEFPNVSGDTLFTIHFVYGDSCMCFSKGDR